mgnify:CR=1 FL=1
MYSHENQELRATLKSLGVVLRGEHYQQDPTGPIGGTCQPEIVEHEKSVYGIDIRPSCCKQIYPNIPEARCAHCRAALDNWTPGVSGNGPQTDFGTGATRSSDIGKIDFEGHINPEVLEVFGEYMNRHRVQRDGQLRGSDNWQKGIPLYRYVKSLIRHVFEFWRMWRGKQVVNPDNGTFFTFRDVTSAVMFNIMGIIYEMIRSDRLDATHVTPQMREQMESGDALKLATSKKEYSECSSTSSAR